MILGFTQLVELEVYRLKTGITWFEAMQVIIIRHAIRAYLKNPVYTLSNWFIKFAIKLGS